jgi:hypothetical protein
VNESTRVSELVWVFRPGSWQPAGLRALAGTPVHAVGVAGADGLVNVVLRNGTRARVTLAEVVAE